MVIIGLTKNNIKRSTSALVVSYDKIKFWVIVISIECSHEGKVSYRFKRVSLNTSDSTVTYTGNNKRCKIILIYNRFEIAITQAILYAKYYPIEEKNVQLY